MIRNINMQEVMKKIDLQNGSSVVLLDRLSKETTYGHMECARNIFLIDIVGKVIWQIESDFDADGGPFTNIIADDMGIRGYRWDGGTYRIELNNGHATPDALLK